MIKKLVLAALLAIVAVPAGYVLYLPDTSKLRTENPESWGIRSYREKQILDRNGKIRSQAKWRRIDQISPHLRHAVVLSEDDMFFQHNGFNMEAMKQAARINWERKKFAFGGSTLTQQLARTLYLSPRKSLLRKAKEALITRRLEKTLTKQRILELYLNVVEWGPQIYGAEAASLHFFGKPASDLTPDEAVALTCILPSPRRWNPLKEGGFIGRRKSILYDRMMRARYIEAPVPEEEVVEESTGTLEVPVDEPVMEEEVVEEEAEEPVEEAPAEEEPVTEEVSTPTP